MARSYPDSSTTKFRKKQQQYLEVVIVRVTVELRSDRVLESAIIQFLEIYCPITDVSLSGKAQMIQQMNTNLPIHDIVEVVRPAH